MTGETETRRDRHSEERPLGGGSSEVTDTQQCRKDTEGHRDGTTQKGGQELGDISAEPLITHSIHHSPNLTNFSLQQQPDHSGT